MLSAMLNRRSLPAWLLQRASRCVPAISCALLAAAPPAGANMAANGGFESGPDPGDVMQLTVGSTALAGWVVTRNPIDYVGTLWAAAEGARSLGLNGSSPGGIAQTIATVPGAPYAVRFWLAGDAFSNPIFKRLRVTAAGQTRDYEFDATHAWPWDLGWVEKTFAFTAVSTATTIEFMSLDAGDTGPTLDKVTVSSLDPLASPDPSPTGFLLAPPIPNPARGDLRIAFEVSSEAPLRLSVMDVQGREVRVLAEARILPGPTASRGTAARPPEGPPRGSTSSGSRVQAPSFSARSSCFLDSVSSRALGPRLYRKIRPMAGQDCGTSLQPSSRTSGSRSTNARISSRTRR